MDAITITIVAVFGGSRRGQQFVVTLDGRTLVTRSTTPILDASRVLLAQGVASTAPLVVRSVSPVSMTETTTTIAEAAELVPPWQPRKGRFGAGRRSENWWRKS